jgi:hypothetical protein
LAALILVIGNGATAYVVLRDLAHLEKSRQRVVVPGDRLVTLDLPGNYTIFYEYRSIVGNRIFSTDPELRSMSSLTCSLIRKNGAEVALVSCLGNKRYSSLKGLAGVSLFDFNISEAGRYVLKGHYEDGRQEPEIVLALAEGFTARLMRMMGIMGTIMIIAIGSAAYVVYKTFVKRRRCSLAKNGENSMGEVCTVGED